MKQHATTAYLGIHGDIIHSGGDGVEDHLPYFSKLFTEYGNVHAAELADISLKEIIRLQKIAEWAGPLGNFNGDVPAMILEYKRTISMLNESLRMTISENETLKNQLSFK